MRSIVFHFFQKNSVRVLTNLLKKTLTQHEGKYTIPQKLDRILQNYNGLATINFQERRERVQ